MTNQGLLRIQPTLSAKIRMATVRVLSCVLPVLIAFAARAQQSDVSQPPARFSAGPTPVNAGGYTQALLRPLPPRAGSFQNASRTGSRGGKFAIGAPSPAPPLFLPVVTYDSGAPGAWSVVSADLNGDGKPDMVVTTSDSVGVLLGDGDGTFRPVVAYPLVGGGGEVAVADVNGDGKPDLIVATAFGSNGDGAAEVLLGNGDGTFQPAVSYDSGGPYTYSIAVGDFNGDGKLDLVVADCSPYTGSSCGLFGILLGNGDGTFKPVTTYSSGGVGAWSLTVADVNGDGKADVVIGNLCADASCAGNGVVAVLLGNGDGTFNAPLTYGSGGRTLWPVVADVNADGKPDIVVANGNGSSGVGILLGNGDGTFQPVVTYPTGEKYVSALAVADVNGDGKPDVVVSDCASGQYTCGTNASVSVLLGNGNGTFQPALTYSSGGVDSIGIALADVNGDGRPDILVANCAPNGGGCNGSMNGVVGVLLNNTVPGNSTTTRLISSLNPSIYGQSVTLTATVTGAGSVPPTGKVNLTWGIYTIGSATLNSSGVATYTRSNLSADSYPLTAVYLGDANNLGSTSAVVNQVVTKASSSTTIISAPNPSASGEVVTFTATITSPTVKPTGPVTFSAGKTVLGTAQLSGGKAKFTTSTLVVGSTKVTATYYGDSNIARSSASVTQTVTP
jgi:hypothetical protein